jgi:hypothetical protein
MSEIARNTVGHSARQADTEEPLGPSKGIGGPLPIGPTPSERRIGILQKTRDRTRNQVAKSSSWKVDAFFFPTLTVTGNRVFLRMKRCGRCRIRLWDVSRLLPRVPASRVGQRCDARHSATARGCAGTRNREL